MSVVSCVLYLVSCVISLVSCVSGLVSLGCRVSWVSRLLCLVCSVLCLVSLVSFVFCLTLTLLSRVSLSTVVVLVQSGNMATRASARQKYTTTIKVFDKVCKRLLGVWVNGKITKIKHSKMIGRSKVTVPRYVVEFDDNKRTQIECGYEEVVEMVALFNERKHTAATILQQQTDARSIVGSAILTL